MIEELKEKFTPDRRAVSPVIGVILMVAITVILAAVIGAFVLNIGQNQQTTPQASFDFSYESSSNELTITHVSGATFSADNTQELRIRGTSGTSATIGSSGLPVSAGEVLTGSSISVTPGETIRVIHVPNSGDKTSTLATFEVPN